MQKLCMLALALALIILPNLVFAADADVPRMTKEELKAKMEKGEGVVILDVRAKGSYDRSKFKIKGSLRIAPDEIEARYKELPLDKEIITYCT